MIGKRLLRYSYKISQDLLYALLLLILNIRSMWGTVFERLQKCQAMLVASPAHKVAPAGYREPLITNVDQRRRHHFTPTIFGTTYSHQPETVVCSYQLGYQLSGTHVTILRVVCHGVNFSCFRVLGFWLARSK